jgi:hypothetical protein
MGYIIERGGYKKAINPKYIGLIAKFFNNIFAII